MAAGLASWPRPHFTPGGGDPFLFYVVFGNFDLKTPLNRTEYRSEGLGGWLELSSHDRAKEPEVFARYQSGKPWELRTRDVPLLTAEAEQAPQCVVLQGETSDPTTLDYFRDTIGIVTWLLDAGGVAVHDPQMLWLWSADEWREEAFEPNRPNPDRHTAILVEPEAAGTSWYHTRGMRKFGRPDLSVRGVGEKYADGVTELIERYVGGQALGHVILESEKVQMKGLPPGGVCRHGGRMDDPDFNNRHVEVVWPANTLR